MKVADVMTKNPMTLRPDDTIGQADEILAEKHFRQLPVVEGNDLLGIITDRDIRSFLGDKLLEGPAEREKVTQTKVSLVMTTKPISVSPDDDLKDAVELLIEERIGGIPVLDEDEGVVGIVTYVDVLRYVLEYL